jgi:undecaprenyl-diphosphatase
VTAGGVPAGPAPRGPEGARSRRVRRLAAHALAGAVLALLFAVDRPLAGVIVSARAPWLSAFLAAVSELRGVVFFAVASAAVFAWGAARRRGRLRRAGAVMFLAVVLSATVVSLVKPVVARDGPLGPVPAEPGESWISARWGRFPSGHTAAAFAAGAGLAACYPAAAPFAYALGAVVGYERIYRNVHFPSDCFAGAWIGITAARWLGRRMNRDGAARADGRAARAREVVRADDPG